MTRLTRDTKVINTYNITSMKKSVNFKAFQEIYSKSRDLVWKKLVAGRRFTLAFTLASAK
jgi:hypothetical protein